MVRKINVKKFLKSMYFLPSDLYNYLIINIKKISVGKGARINGKINIIGDGIINIGEYTVINSSKFANPVGKNLNTTLYVINNSKLIIGNNTGISNSTICSCSGIKIGDNVKIGGGCEIYDTDFHSINYINRRKKIDKNIKSKPINICNDVFIGANSTILKGVTIGERSIVGAGSVVTRSIPKDEMWAGNPARFIKKIEYYND